MTYLIDPAASPLMTHKSDKKGKMYCRATGCG
jgi:hypothetical protein